MEAPVELLTTKEVCSVLRISRSKLYSLWAIGAGPSYVQIGGQRRVRADVLEAWVDEQASVT